MHTRVPISDIINIEMYKVVQIWPGLIVCKQATVCPGHIWTTLYVQEIVRWIVDWIAVAEIRNNGSKT
jgi:hypothetical protein